MFAALDMAELPRASGTSVVADGRFRSACANHLFMAADGKYV